MELDVVPQADAVLHHGWLVQVIEPAMLMVLLHYDVDWTACLFHVDLTTLTRDNVYSRGPQNWVILNRPKEAWGFPWQEDTQLDDVTEHHPANCK
jgi:hypothetical protein